MGKILEWFDGDRPAYLPVILLIIVGLCVYLVYLDFLA
jgi:hypothetical protein